MKRGTVTWIAAIAAVAAIILLARDAGRDATEESPTPSASASASPTPPAPSVNTGPRRTPTPTPTPAPQTPAPTPTPTPAPEATVGFSASAYSVAEDERFVTITVSRTVISGANVTVKYETVDGTAHADDYLRSSGTFVFGAGVATHTFTVEVRDDTEWEGDETIILRLSGVEGAAVGIREATLTISDDESHT